MKNNKTREYLNNFYLFYSQIKIILKLSNLGGVWLLYNIVQLHLYDVWSIDGYYIARGSSQRRLEII